MKNLIKYLCVVILIVPCIFLFGACSLFEKEIVNSIDSVEKTATNGLVDTYTITYTDGTTSTFTVTNGADGEDGLNGEDGTDGLNGTDGEDGQTGISIVSIEKTGTQGLVDTYTITFSDSSTTTFTITNGADGIDGEDGIDGTNGLSIVSINKTGTNGLIDTYTITFSDSSTTTFTITNGADGEDGLDGADGDDLTVSNIYTTALDNGFEGTLLEFMEQYLSANVNDLSLSINKALMSAVCIFNNEKAGSGVIYELDKISGDALIITNYHVAYNTDTNVACTGFQLFIYGEDPFDDGDAIPATVLGGSLTYDIAVLKVTNSNVLKNSDAMAAEIVNSNEIIVGGAAFAIGNPEASGMSVTCGIVSLDSEYIEIEGIEDSFRVMRIDTAVNGGNSGGGLFNNEGKLIGIVNAKIEELGIEGMAFAIPSNNATGVVENIIANCNGTTSTKIKVFAIGISIDGDNTRAVYDTESLIARIYEDVVITDITSTPFALQIGDTIKSIQINSGDVITLNRDFTLLDTILKVCAGDTVKLTIERSGTPHTLTYQTQVGDFIIVD